VLVRSATFGLLTQYLIQQRVLLLNLLCLFVYQFEENIVNIFIKDSFHFVFKALSKISSVWNKTLTIQRHWWWMWLVDLSNVWSHDVDVVRPRDHSEVVQNGGWKAKRLYLKTKKNMIMGCGIYVKIIREESYLKEEVFTQTCIL